MEQSLIGNAEPVGEFDSTPTPTTSASSAPASSKEQQPERKEEEEVEITKGEWRFPNPIFGSLYILHLFVSGIFGALVLTLPSLLILPFFPNIFRKWNEFVASSWFVFVVVHFEWFLGVEVQVFSQEENLYLFKEENALIISNHRTSFDWKYLWAVLLRYARLKNEKIFLKDSLKWVPGWGWAMQFFCFLFLHRKWEEDEIHIGQILKYFEATSYPVQLLLFPEGTDFYSKSLKASNKFAKANQLKPYTQVLHPRVRGFSYTVQTARPSLHAIYDLTIAYPDVIPQPEGTIFLGQLPKKVHVLIERHPISTIPTETESLDEWCRQCFDKKEARLSNYYSSPAEKSFSAPLVDYSTLPSPSSSSGPSPSIKKLNLGLVMLSCFLMWVILEIVGIYLLIFNFWVQVYFISTASFFILETYLFGGIQYAELALHYFKHPIPDSEIVHGSPLPLPRVAREHRTSSSGLNQSGEIGPDTV